MLIAENLDEPQPRPATECQMFGSTIVVPAYQPPPELVSLVDGLLNNGFMSIIVVNDGSSRERCGTTFDALRERAGVVILDHETKRGKGEALKTAFNYVLTNRTELKGVITVDADGQHRLEDVLKVAREFELEPSKLCLGVRSFNQDTPLRSRIGNEASRLLFKLIVGTAISDTQTGLRAIPKTLLPGFVELKASGYEFELEALMHTCNSQVRIKQVPIAAVYLNNNASSHFNPILDSLKIYFVLFRFALTSLSTFVIDTIVFASVYAWCGSLLGSAFAARSIAGVYNFLTVRSFVFKSKGDILTQVLSYAGLVLGLMFVSYGLTLGFIKTFAAPPVVANAMSNSLLFFANFTIQRLFLFRNGDSETTQSTNWDAYYKKPAKAASITRTITGAYLLRLLKRYHGDKPAHVVELGGANSCFFKMLQKKLEPQSYTIVDNNPTGLNASQQLVADCKTRLICADILDHEFTGEPADICYSVGLIEHFDEVGTNKAIAAHFRATKPGGIVLITFPTPTWLYRLSRKIVESLGLWIFHDERPLTTGEVRNRVKERGTILYESINWWIFLTQAIIVVRADSDQGVESLPQCVPSTESEVSVC